MMDIPTLTSFFMWCSVINVSLLTFWFATYALAPEFVYRTQNKWIPISRETFSLLFYGFLGIFKIFILVFNVVPYVALLIIG